ncbi:ABC-type polysaccharide/polyol phosphate export systems, permease component [Desulfitobacterium dichloroeliminans LMG P-21439]|uniref:Transport permease protein n=1 Tax=Desulfitobacterium dichloroeliminans (strain LMG P-21439 / DCA1) TaxID=871963 RepID=L0F575_DESDL|nr:ABC transporter permease [Desulfitobacterium dichloroeliminans]AGA68984.1 ABC-type polysaccharide/polyol phosphate export systems, permease component [Desulfitobacterium dichloroeliminans LMG P-21439]
MSEIRADITLGEKKRSLWNPSSMVASLWQNRELIKQFVKREVIGRYKGSYLGLFWSFLNPLFMLAVYSFVFSVVFEAKWGIGTGSKIEFALVLFCGLTTFNIFAEVISRAPNLIVSNVNYVKKVVFPLEILPIVVLGSALVQAAISLVLLVSALVVFMGIFHWTMLLLPLVLLPQLLLVLGAGWFLASLGIFLRDIGHVIMIIVQVLMFMTPIFYPITAVPEKLRWMFEISPIYHVVDDMRRIFIWGQLPSWNWLILNILLSSCIAILGYVWFQRTRGGFADVL